MATRSSTLAWGIPWTEEPGGLQSVGSQKLDTTGQLNNNFQVTRNAILRANMAWIWGQAGKSSILVSTPVHEFAELDTPERLTYSPSPLMNNVILDCLFNF